jgi:hypothetical protein
MRKSCEGMDQNTVFNWGCRPTRPPGVHGSLRLRIRKGHPQELDEGTMTAAFYAGSYCTQLQLTVYSMLIIGGRFVPHTCEFHSERFNCQ